MENSRHFRELFDKYLDNRCSPAEVEYLLRLMQVEAYNQVANEMIESRLKRELPASDSDRLIREKLDIRLQSILNESSRPARTVIRLHRWKWIAAAGVLLIAFITIYRFGAKDVPDTPKPIARAPLAAAPLTGYTRYITLPDGSSVVLHAGSKLEYPASFQGKNREVVLSGEAYFDVTHNPAQPFIIHTGTVKTTVLGTAFNIKSDEKQVTVSVTRGKVKVEDGTKVLAVLTPDQQVAYDLGKASGIQHTVNADSIVTDWTKRHMVFNGDSFEEIARMLSQRYGVPILFRNDDLKKCKIRASFSGTETLDHIASVLSAIRNGSFEQLSDGTIVFSGEGCE